jgi:hypothetical protein
LISDHRDRLSHTGWLPIDVRLSKVPVIAIQALFRMVEFPSCL